MKTHRLSLLIVALLVAMLLPVPASAALGDRARRRSERNESQAAARANTPPAGVRYRAYWKGRTDLPSPREWDDWAYEAPLRARGYYRRNGLPAPSTSRGTVAAGTRNQNTAPRNFVEQSDASVEQLPALHEPTLADAATGRVEPASATEPLPNFNAQTLAASSSRGEPRVACAANQRT
jgi:hypothetical protein